MRILFVHQNFPSQYQHIVHQLAKLSGHQLVALSIEPPEQSLPEQLELLRYQLSRGNSQSIHPLLLESESKILRAEACASACHQLSQKGYKPELICCHPGWGEALFLAEIWPDVPMLCYQEFFYHTSGFDCNFDPEFDRQPGWNERAVTVMKNTHLLLTLEKAAWNVTPTNFQKSSFPSAYRDRFSVIHDGINVDEVSPSSRPLTISLPDGKVIQSGQPIVTFVNRTLEPYRGCHTFLRAIPEIHKLCPEAEIVIVGATQGVSYGSRCPKGEWLDYFLPEINGRYDPERLHFCGRISRRHYLSLLQLSACHVYLTYPFVLSWSMLEAMSTGCAVIGSATSPVMELIDHGVNGMIVDFFSPSDLSAMVVEMLQYPERFVSMRHAARKTIQERYSLEHCVPRHLALMELVASRALP